MYLHSQIEYWNDKVTDRFLKYSRNSRTNIMISLTKIYNVTNIDKTMIKSTKLDFGRYNIEVNIDNQPAVFVFQAFKDDHNSGKFRALDTLNDKAREVYRLVS